MKRNCKTKSISEIAYSSDFDVAFEFASSVYCILIHRKDEKYLSWWIDRVEISNEFVQRLSYLVNLIADIRGFFRMKSFPKN